MSGRRILLKSSGSSTTGGRSSGCEDILTLYRQCLRSVRKIPDIEQRTMYYEYVKDGFKSKRGIPPDSREAKFAVRDAKEQLERMNYYHSIRDMKLLSEQQELQQQQNMISNDDITSSSSPAASATAADASLTMTKTSAFSSTNAVGDNDGGGSGGNASSSSVDFDLTKLEIVQRWIRDAVPFLHVDDVRSYAAKLIDDGFDSVPMIERELTLDDVQFMKTAHRRALVRSKQSLFGTSASNTVAGSDSCVIGVGENDDADDDDDDDDDNGGGDESTRLIMRLLRRENHYVRRCIACNHLSILSTNKSGK